MNYAIDMSEPGGPRTFAFDFADDDGTRESWSIEVYEDASIEFFRNGITMGSGVVGYESVTCWPSELKRAQPKVYPSVFPAWRVEAGYELWFLKQLQMNGAIESDAAMQVRATEKRHRRAVRQSRKGRPAR